MTVHATFSEIDHTQWQELVVQSSTASFFQTPECYQFYASLSFMKPFVFGVSEKGKLVGILSGYIISDGNIISKFLSRRAIVCGGPLLDNNISENALKQLLITARRSLKRKAIYFEIRNYNNYTRYKSFFESAGFSYSPHLNFHLDSSGFEVANQNLKGSKRRNIKLTRKEGADWVATTDPIDIKAFYEILKNLYLTKVKTPLFPIEFFEKIVLLWNAKLLVVKYKERIIGGGLFVILQDKTIYEWFVCGEDKMYKNIYPSILATWAGIEYATQNNLSVFDFMGAGKPDVSYGVRQFKSEFGGDLVEDGRFISISNPFLYKLGKIAVGILRYTKKPKKVSVNSQLKTTYFVESQIQQINRNDWSDFVLKHPNGTVFQTPEMYEVYLKTPNFTPIIVIAKDKRDKIVGCVMSVIKKESNGFIGELTARSIIMGGPLAEENNQEILNVLLENYNKLVSRKAIYSQFRNLFKINSYSLPFTKNGYRFEEHLDILINLKKTKEELEEQLHKERKRNIAKAVKEGLTFKVLDDEDDVKTVISLIKKTYNRVKVPFSYEELFLNSLSILDKNVKFFGAFWEGKMIAGQVRLCYKSTVYAWYAGSDSEYFHKRPNDFLLWNVILWAKENNYSVFDFGGAGKPDVPYGVRDYKLKFGGDLVNYGRYEKEHKKLFMFMGKNAFKLYKFIKR